MVLLARQNVWLRVTSDGTVIFEGRMTDGEVRSFTAEEALELETGNVIALEIVHNQTQLEPLSDRLGTAARILFTIDGIQEFPITSPDLQLTPTPDRRMCFDPHTKQKHLYHQPRLRKKPG